MATTEVPKAYNFFARRKSSAPSGGKSGGGKIGIKALSGVAGVPSSREVGGMADGVEGPPQLEKQEALRATAAGPAYTPGSLMGIITGNKTGESNPNFDAAKPIGGDNVPFKETTGIGGWFSRLAGNKANQLNAAAQQEQAADWKSEEAELRKARIEDERFARSEGAAAKRFEMARKAQVEDRDLAMEQQRIRDASKWVDEDADREQAAIDRIKAREMQAAELQAQKDFRTQQLALEQQKLDAMKQPKPISPELRDIGGIGYMTKGDEIFRVEGNNLVPVRALPQYKGGASGVLPPGGGVTAPGATLPPQGQEPVNNAILPKALRGARELLGGAFEGITDPVIMAGESAYQNLLDDQYKVNPERLKRVRAAQENIY